MPDLPADPRKRLFMKLHLCQPVTGLKPKLLGYMATIDGDSHQPVRILVPRAHSFLTG